MTTPVSHTYEEIISQPKAWAQALEVTRTQKEEITKFWDEHPKMQVVFTGWCARGSGRGVIPLSSFHL
jgi:fructoselysine-6-P-deglycase FrlB-like protein